MEWISGSGGPRLFRCEGCTALLTSRLLRTCPALINARLGHRASFPCFVLGWKWKCWCRDFAFRQQSFGEAGRVGVRRRWGTGERRGGGTRSLGDRSPGNPSVWQLWKFIAIDFVISSLSIRSTWAHWWIAGKLFLQSCFLFHPLLHWTERHALCPLFIPICWDVSIALFIFPLL